MFLDKFRVYYGTIPANQICNGVAPGYRHIIGGWDEAAVRKREKGSAAYRQNLNNKNGFYDKLLESVRSEGVLNPISICAGYCVTIYQKYLYESMLNEDGSPNWEKVLVCDRKGGSRLWAAQQLDIDIPVMVSDFVGMFDGNPNFKELFTEEQILNVFTHRPNVLHIDKTGLNIGNIPHIHLDDPTEAC